MRRAALAAFWLLLVPSAALAQSTTANAATRLYLRAWYPWSGVQAAAADVATQRLIETADLALKGRIGEAQAILQAAARAKPSGMAAWLLVAFWDQLQVTRFGDWASADSVHIRFGDLALRSAEERVSTRASFPRSTLESSLRTISDIQEAARLSRFMNAVSALTSRIVALQGERTRSIVAATPFRVTDDKELQALQSCVDDLVHDGILSSDQAIALVATFAGSLHRAQGHPDVATGDYRRGLDAARRSANHWAEFEYLTRLGDVARTPFGDPEFGGFSMEAEWELAGVVDRSNLGQVYGSPSENQKQAAQWYAEAEAARAKYLPDRFAGELIWRQFLADGGTNQSTALRRCATMSEQQGERRVWALCSAQLARAAGDDSTFEKSVRAEVDLQDDFGAFRIFDDTLSQAQIRRSVNDVTTAMRTLELAAPVALAAGFRFTAARAFVTLGIVALSVGRTQVAVEASRKGAGAINGYLSASVLAGLSPTEPHIALARSFLFLTYSSWGVALASRVTQGEAYWIGPLRELDAVLERLKGTVDAQTYASYQRARGDADLRTAVAGRILSETEDCGGFVSAIDAAVDAARTRGLEDVVVDGEMAVSRCAPERAAVMAKRLTQSDVAPSLIDAINSYAKNGRTERERVLDAQIAASIRTLNRATALNQWEWVATSIQRVRRAADADSPALAQIVGQLDADEAVSLCGLGRCGDARDLLERALATRGTVPMLSASVEVESRSGDALGTMFSLERLWYYNDIIAFRQFGSAAELGYLQARYNNPANTVAAVERRRLDELEGLQRADTLRNSTPPTREQVRAALAALPPRTTVLAFHLAASALIVCRVSSDGTAEVKRIERPDDIVRLSRRLASRLSQRVDDWRSLATALYQEIFPKLGDIPDGDTIAIAAATGLGPIPFEVLGRDADHLLVMRHPILYVHRLVASRTRATGRGTSDAVVGVNAEGLQFAEIEAGRVASALKAKPLVGPQATYASITSMLKIARRIHIAGHVRFDPLNPFGTEFVLANGETMKAWEFAGALRDPDLVFLSGCDTQATARVWQNAGGGVGPSADTVGAVLTSSGAVAVVGTLWKLDDAAGLDVVDGFYAALADRRTYAAALMAAKTPAIKRGLHPYYWAPLVLTVSDLSDLTR